MHISRSSSLQVYSREGQFVQRAVGYLYVFLISWTLALFMQETCTHLLYMHCELPGWRVLCTCSDLLYTPPQLQVTSCMQPLRRYGKYVCIYTQVITFACQPILYGGR